MSSYHYQSYSKTTTTATRTSGGYSHSTTTTTTRTSGGDSSALVVRELTESEVSNLSLSDSPSNYEISDEDRLTKYDFYSLMNSEDELDSETDSESDVEYHWFPSLLRTSFIQFLDDKEQENYMDDDTNDDKVQVIENENEESSSGQEEKEEDDEMDVKHSNSGKRHHRRHTKKHTKRPRKTEQVPVEVIHLLL